jgi:putative addiction module component (TIGR02574 family)
LILVIALLIFILRIINIKNKAEGSNMSNKEIIESALKLSPPEKLLIVESILRSLDEPDKEIENIWIEEAEKRLQAYRDGKLEGIPMEDIFKSK